MDKRTLLAVALASLVLLGWSLLTSKFYHIQNKIVTEQAPSPTTPISEQALTPKPELELTAPSFKLSREQYEITFVEPLAAIKEIMFKDYSSYNFPLQYGFLLGSPNLIFHKESVSENSVKFIYEDQEKKILKEFNFLKSNYSIELAIVIQNLSSARINVDLPLVLGVLDFNRDPMQARFQDVTVALKEKTIHINGQKDALFEEAQFLGFRDRYFCVIAQPESDKWQGRIKKISPKKTEVYLSLKELTILPGQQVEQKFHIYLGPQDLKYIARVEPEWSAIIYYGSFDLIGHLLLQLLGILYKLVHNWGWVIIVLSVLIYFLLFPLSLKQMRSMKQMQALQPAIEELRNKYKDNPQKLNKETLELYRQNKVNPFAGCLPMVLQIPIFFALYQVLIRSIVLKGANFLWIKDLSEPDRFLLLPVSLPILGNEVNILPILMAIGMFIQQKISLKTASGGSAEQQKMMMIIMPIMFGFIFYRMPAGLVLYWFINSSLMLVYQFRINRSK
jgi:YidC/Oxa1 family membrane protein insertase